MILKDNISLFVGRFNPLTVYHRQIIEQMTGHRFVMATTSHGNRDPLETALKIRLLRRMVRSVGGAPSFVASTLNLFDALTLTRAACSTINPSTPLPVILHCGADRERDCLRLNTYTEQTGIEIVDLVVHNRLDDTHSATHARTLAKLGNWEAFKEICGYNTEADKHAAYVAIQQYYAGLQGKTSPRSL